MMAGDRQFSLSAGTKLLGKTKIYDVPHPEIFGMKRAFVGFCGDVGNFADANAWLHMPEGKPPKLRDVELLILSDKGKIYHGTSLTNFLEIHDPFFAIGSGMHYAISAMACGKDPEEAVKVAHKYDVMTGLQTTTLKL